uniref:Uncharacterized protein n=1 Tax=Romanomermis culicivorax TaxID=13658 RepID=A0A915IHI6_ROMCU
MDYNGNQCSINNGKQCKLTASQQRVGDALKRVLPVYHENRRKGIQNQLYPSPYYAPYFGYNLHMDRNEKVINC